MQKYVAIYIHRHYFIAQNWAIVFKSLVSFIPLSVAESKCGTSNYFRGVFAWKLCSLSEELVNNFLFSGFKLFQCQRKGR